MKKKEYTGPDCCKNCSRFIRPAKYKRKKCADDILPRRDSWKGDKCLWWREA